MFALEEGSSNGPAGLYRGHRLLMTRDFNLPWK